MSLVSRLSEAIVKFGMSLVVKTSSGILHGFNSSGARIWQVIYCDHILMEMLLILLNFA